MYNAQLAARDGPVLGLHVRGPQLNLQRDPRWGRNANSPGEDAYLQGEYSAADVGGAGGAAERDIHFWRETEGNLLHETLRCIKCGGGPEHRR